MWPLLVYVRTTRSVVELVGRRRGHVRQQRGVCRGDGGRGDERSMSAATVPPACLERVEGIDPYARNLGGVCGLRTQPVKLCEEAAPPLRRCGTRDGIAGCTASYFSRLQKVGARCARGLPVGKLSQPAQARSHPLHAPFGLLALRGGVGLAALKGGDEKMVFESAYRVGRHRPWVGDDACHRWSASTTRRLHTHKSVGLYRKAYAKRARNGACLHGRRRHPRASYATGLGADGRGCQRTASTRSHGYGERSRRGRRGVVAKRSTETSTTGGGARERMEGRRHRVGRREGVRLGARRGGPHLHATGQRRRYCFQVRVQHSVGAACLALKMAHVCRTDAVALR